VRKRCTVPPAARAWHAALARDLKCPARHASATDGTALAERLLNVWSTVVEGIMSTIVCATDFSPDSARVVVTAGAFARLLGGAHVELLHVLHAPPNIPSELLDGEVVRDLNEAAEAMIAKQAEMLRARGVEVRTSVRAGLAENLAEHACALHADLLVVGTHGRKGAAHFFLGSVAERTIRTAPCPVVVVPASPAGRLAREDAADAAPLKIVVGVDVSPGSGAALDWLDRLRARAPCDVHLVHLFSPTREHQRLGLEPSVDFQTDKEVIDVIGRELRAHIEAHLPARPGREPPLRIRPSWKDEDDPLAWEAESDDADLLLIGTDQTRHSAALATVRGARLPVLCVPAPRAAAAARPTEPIRTVLVPTDFSPAGNAAVEEAYRLVSGAGGTVVLAHVAKPDQFGLDPSRQEEIETCLLALVPPDVDTARTHTRAFATADRSPGEAILKAVRRFGADMVVIASHGSRHRGHAAVTEHVVWNSPRPVVVVPT
jgi:nucleotide-binding universal stress UspA family protein